MYFMKFFLFARKNFLWKCRSAYFVEKKKKKGANFSNFFGFYNVSFTIKIDVK